MSISNSKQYLASNLQIIIGQRVKEEHPEIADLYRKGLSHRKIAQELEVIGDNCGARSIDVLEHAVKYALTGNSGEYGPQYSGLINLDEYEAISRDHRVQSGESTGSLMVKLKKGAHRLSHEQLVNASRNAAVARGQIPWTDAEKVLAYFLSCDSSCRSDKDPKYRSNKKIAYWLNLEFHEGKEIRDESSVSNMFRRWKEYNCL
jgi:hypothetical protein